MFARLKRTGERAYFVIVESVREHPVLGGETARRHRQIEIARPGRVDHLAPEDQQRIVIEGAASPRRKFRGSARPDVR